MNNDKLPVNLPDLIHQVGLDLTETQAILLADALSDSKTKNISLPQFYETAVAAIGQCDAIDECQSFIGIAEMIRAYAAQARDKRMIVTARRMHARAWRRLGELLLQYPSGHSGASRRVPEHLLVDKRAALNRKPLPKQTRRTVARVAGLSVSTTAKAIKIGKIPTDLFEQVVEGEDSISINGLMLLDRGDAPGMRHNMGARARGGLRSNTIKAMRAFSLIATNHRPDDLARCFPPHDAKLFAAQLIVIRAWLVAMDRAIAKLVGQSYE